MPTATVTVITARRADLLLCGALAVLVSHAAQAAYAAQPEWVGLHGCYTGSMQAKFCVIACHAHRQTGALQPKIFLRPLPGQGQRYPLRHINRRIQSEKRYPFFDTFIPLNRYATIPIRKIHPCVTTNHKNINLNLLLLSLHLTSFQFKS